MKKDQAPPSLFAKGKERKRKQTKKEKILTVVGIAVAVAALLTALGIVTASVIRGQRDEQNVEGYWYTEKENLCWRFENGFVREYRLVDVDYILYNSYPYELDADQKTLTFRYESEKDAVFTYKLKGDSLTLSVGETVLEMHRGKAPQAAQ